MIGVIGGRDPVARSIVDHLATSGHAVRVLTGDPDHSDLPSVAEVLTGDLRDPDALARALVGVRAVYLRVGTWLGARYRDIIGTFLDIAINTGVERVVLRSSGAIDEWAGTQDDPVAALYHGIECDIRSSGLGWTFLRLEVASADALRWAFQVPRQLAVGDVVRGPYAGAAGSPIHPADFAAVAVAALTDRAHDGRVYPVTGPASMTHAEQVRLIGAVRGRTCYFDEIDEATARTRINPAAPADLLFATWAKHVGMPAPITDTVQRLTGRPPRTPRQWALDYPRG